MLSEIIVRLKFAVECVIDMRSCSFVTNEMFIVTLEHFKCDELAHPPVLHATDGALRPVLGHAAGQKHLVRAQEHDRGQTRDADGEHSVRLCCPSLLLSNYLTKLMTSIWTMILP